MTIGLVGRKVGMTRVFTEDGVSTPVTVLEVEANRVAQVKTVDNDGYSALQVTTGKRKASRVTKPAAGHFAKAGIEAGRGLWEFRLNENEGGDIEAGSEITVEIFNDTKLVDVTGTSKGKGFQGGIKRWNFTMQDATHGNSISHRSNGSLGQCQTPGRVFQRQENVWSHGCCARVLHKTLYWFVLMRNVTCCLLKAQFRVLSMAT